jgi:hypothetical protein
MAVKKKDNWLETLMKDWDSETFHDKYGGTFITLNVKGHRETWEIDPKGCPFTQRLAYLYYRSCGKFLPSGDVTQGIQHLHNVAAFEGTKQEVALRVGGHEKKVYLDLVNDAWEAVQIDADGWRIVKNPPVRFWRSSHIQELPRPVQGGSIEELRGILNVGNERAWHLIVAWLLSTLMVRGPYPLLLLHGPQGSGKSTTARNLRKLVDESAEPFRDFPRKPDDIAAAARNNRIIAFDNVSLINDRMSDLMAQVSTGSAHGAREFYKQTTEVVIGIGCPQLLNGIGGGVIHKPDLLDRSIVVDLPVIQPDARRTEEELSEQFEEARPRILGALLTAVHVGLRRRYTYTPKGPLPRMADFGLWAECCGKSFGWAPGQFLREYAEHQREADLRALGDWVVFPYLKMLLDDAGGQWSGTYQKLLEDLGRCYGRNKGFKPASWPTEPRALSAQLTTYEPNLKKVGIFLDDLTPSSRGNRLAITKQLAA